MNSVTENALRVLECEVDYLMINGLEFDTVKLYKVHQACGRA
jgi:hypothetical protein